MLPVTLITAAGCALLTFWLSLRIGRVRMGEKISVGDGGNERLVRRMRAQANFVENAPFVLALIAAIELVRGTGMALWIASGVFLIARVLHAFGMDGGKLGVARTIGFALSVVVLLALAVWAVYLVIAGGATMPARTFGTA